MNLSIDALQTTIKRLCEEKGITLNKLSDQAGLRNSTVMSIMNGRSKDPQMKTLHKIANGFGVDFDYLMTRWTCAQYELEPLPNNSQYREAEAVLDIAKKVRGLREARGLSLYDFHEATGLPMEIEIDAAIHYAVLAKLCSYFNVTADYFLGLTDEPLPISSGSSRKRKVS